MKKLLLVALVSVCTPVFAAEEEKADAFIRETNRRLKKRSAELKQKFSNMQAEDPVAFARFVADYNEVYGRHYGITTEAALTGNTMPATPIATAHSYPYSLSPISLIEKAAEDVELDYKQRREESIKALQIQIAARNAQLRRQGITALVVRPVFKRTKKMLTLTYADGRLIKTIEEQSE